MALASHGEVAGSGTAAQNLPGEMLLGAPRLLVVAGQRREVGRELGAKLVGAVARDGQPGAVCRAIGANVATIRNPPGVTADAARLT
jgi:hypothetical protein